MHSVHHTLRKIADSLATVTLILRVNSSAPYFTTNCVFLRYSNPKSYFSTLRVESGATVTRILRVNSYAPYFTTNCVLSRYSNPKTNFGSLRVKSDATETLILRVNSHAPYFTTNCVLTKSPFGCTNTLEISAFTELMAPTWEAIVGRWKIDCLIIDKWYDKGRGFRKKYIKSFENQKKNMKIGKISKIWKNSKTLKKIFENF